MLAVLAELVAPLAALMAEVPGHHTTVAVVHPIFVLELIASMLELLLLAVEDLTAPLIKLVCMVAEPLVEVLLKIMVLAVAVVHRLPVVLVVMEMVELLERAGQA
nr:MAG TPA: hypothetical protein [Caudoviricetes sp.]